MNPIIYFNEIKDIDVSIVTVTMNRHDNLLSSIHSWINLPIKEIIIIDWCSDDLFESLIPSYLKLNKNFYKIKFYRVDGFDKWVLTWAFNLGFHLSTSEYILKLDADIIVDKNFFSLNNIKKEKNIFFRGCWKKSLQMYLNGQFYCKKSCLVSIGYYNEFIDTYGYDDDDLYKRLKKTGLVDVLIKGLKHIFSDDKSRMRHQNVINLDVETQYNRFKSLHSPVKPFDIARFIVVGANQPMTPLLNLGAGRSLLNLTIVDTHINYNDEMHKHSEKLFADKIVEKKKIIIKDDKFVLLKVFNGIGNRLRALISMVCFCQTYHYKLYVIWEQTQGFDNSSFQDLFTYSNDSDISFIETSYIDITQMHFDYTASFNEYKVASDKKFKLEHSKIYVETGDYAFNTLHIGLPYHGNLYKNIGPSEKVSNILKYINENVTKYSIYNTFHIRRGDAFCKNNKTSHNYTLSSIYMFAKYINEAYIRGEKNLILSDDYEYCNRFLTPLCIGKKNNNIDGGFCPYATINENNFNKNALCNGPKKFILQDAVDFFLFKDSIKIYGTNWSTYTEISSQIFDKEHIKVLDDRRYTLLKNVDYPENDKLVKQYLPYINNYIDKHDLKNCKDNLITTEKLDLDIKYLMINLDETDEQIINSVYNTFYCDFFATFKKS